MHFHIDFPVLNIYLMNEMTNFPFASLFCTNARFAFEKFEDAKKELAFMAETLAINFYEYFNSNDELLDKEDIESYKQASYCIEACFIGDISKTEVFEYFFYFFWIDKHIDIDINNDINYYL